MRNFKFIAGVALVSLFASVQAKRCCDRWGYVGFAAFVQAGTSVISTLTSSTAKIINQAEMRLKPTIANGFGQASVELAKQTAHQRIIAEGRMTVDAAMAIERDSALAAVNAVPAAQQSLTITSSVMAAQQSTVVRKKAEFSDLAFSQQFQTTNRSLHNEIFAKHAKYCSTADLHRMKCDGLASATLQNADLSIATLQNPGEGQDVTLSDQERDAARAFVANVIIPFPHAPPPTGAAETPQAQYFEALLLTDQAVLSLAAHSLNSQIEFRTRRHQL